MKRFEKYIVKNHPDPDRLFNDETIYDDFVNLAEAFVKENLIQFADSINIHDGDKTKIEKLVELYLTKY